MERKQNAEAVVCGLCPARYRIEFATRRELYQHFENHHDISQQFRSYNDLHTNQNRIKADCTENWPNEISDNNPTSTGTEIVLPDAAVPLRNSVQSTNRTAPPIPITDLDSPSSLMETSNSPTARPSESQSSFSDLSANNHITETTLARQLAMYPVPMLNMISPHAMPGNQSNETTVTVHYPPTQHSNGGVTLPPGRPLYQPYNIHPLSGSYRNIPDTSHTHLNGQIDLSNFGSQFYPPPLLWPCADRHVVTNADKENVTTNRQNVGLFK